MIRELFVELGEQTIAAIKAQADEHEAKHVPITTHSPAPINYFFVSDLERALQYSKFEDPSMRIVRDSSDRMFVISHRCKLCNKRHRRSVPEEEVVCYSFEQTFDKLFAAFESLMSTPCNIELGKK